MYTYYIYTILSIQYAVFLMYIQYTYTVSPMYTYISCIINTICCVSNIYTIYIYIYIYIYTVSPMHTYNIYTVLSVQYVVFLIYIQYIYTVSPMHTYYIYGILSIQ